MVHRGLRQTWIGVSSEGRSDTALVCGKLSFFAEKEAFFFSQVFPDNEVTKGQLTMELKRLRMIQDGVTWPKENVDLPVISYQSCECGDLSTHLTFSP